MTLGPRTVNGHRKDLPWGLISLIICLLSAFIVALFAPVVGAALGVTSTVGGLYVQLNQMRAGADE